MGALLPLVLTNLRRHRLRSLVGAAGVAWAAAFMLTVLGLVLGAVTMFQRILAEETDLLVHERGVADLFFSSVRQDEVSGVAALPGVASASPILFGIVSAPDHPVVTCFGLLPGDARLDVSRWRGGKLADFTLGGRSVCLGRRAAEFLQAGVGGEVELGRERFKVAGILECRNGFEDGGVFFPLPLAQEFFHRDSVVSLVSVKLAAGASKDGVKQLVDKKFDRLIAMEPREFNNNYAQFRILRSLAWAVGLGAFVLGGLGVANTLLMSVFSRVREIAVLRVCGFSRPQVAALVMAESLILALSGFLAGSVLGVVLLRVLEKLPFLQGYVESDLPLGAVFGVGLVALATAVLGAAYPAWHASRIQPAAALRWD